MERYYEYKDSGIEWIGEMPLNWSISPAKAIWSVRKEFSDKTTSSGKLLSVSEYYGVAPRSTKIDSEETLMRADSLEGYQFCYPGDLVMNIMLAWKGAHGVSDYSGVVSPAYAVYKQKDLEIAYPKFMHYLLRCDMYKTVFKRWSTGIIDSRLRLYPDVFMRIPIILPPLKTQKIISEYLDSKTAEIDSLIEKTERSIELLEEYRKSVISEAVTKGLDPNAPMKDSGIEWIGEIPAHWSIAPLKRYLMCPITDGPHETPEFFDEGIPFVSAEAVSAGNGAIDFNHMRGFISEEYYQECCKKYIPKRGDIFMIKSGATTGRVAILDQESIFTIWSPLAAIRCNPNNLNPHFAFYFLQSEGFQKQVEDGWTYGTQQNIGMRTIEKLIICVPPLCEQEQIIKGLIKKVEFINMQIELKKAFLLKISEYRKSLISEAVTGKFKVPGVE